MGAKAHIGQALGRALQGRLLRRPMQRFFGRQAPVIFYHGLWPDGSVRHGVFGGRSLDGFREDMRRVAAHFRFAPLDEVLAHNASGDPPSAPVVAISFDDGHDMIRTGALEIFSDFGISATVFVITAVIGSPRLMWMHRLSAVAHQKGPSALASSFDRVVGARRCGPLLAAGDRLPYAARPWPMAQKDEIAAEIYADAGMPPEADVLEAWQPYMSWADLRGWIAAGHQVGLHTATHPFCSRLTAEDVDAEFVGPAALLRRELGLGSGATGGPLPFAYPFGDRLADPALERSAMARAGLSCMLGVEGLSPLGTPPERLERVEAEAGLDLRLFARPALRALAGRRS